MLNDYYQNIGYKGFIKRYGLINAIKRGLFNAFSFHYVKDYETRKLLWQRKASKKVKKYLKYKNDDVKGITYNKDLTVEPVWVYWDSGLDKAPTIVKKCYESIVKYSNREVILLTKENADDYVLLPEVIRNRISSGKISMAAYTDLLRFCLLEHYGGTWIDSTILLTGNIPNEIYDSDFFVMRNSMCLIDNPVLFPAWFISAKKTNDTIRKIRNIAIAYWLENKYIPEYLFPNLIITELLKEEKEIMKKIPYMNTDYSEYMVRILGDKFDKEKYEWVTKLTPIHKLTYKLDKSIENHDNFYNYIINR